LQKVAEKEISWIKIRLFGEFGPIMHTHGLRAVRGYDIGTPPPPLGKFSEKLFIKFLF
jgi:hypothetical protein